MRKIISVLLASLLTSGCVTMENQPISMNNRSAMKGKSIAYTARENKDFTMMTPEKGVVFGVFGLVGGAIAFAAAKNGENKMLNNNHIHDPAPLIAAGISENLKAAYGTSITMPPVQVKDADIDQIIAAANGVQYVVDVQTQRWGFGYLPFDLQHYHVDYKAHMRVIDARTKTTIAAGNCSYKTDKNEKSITSDALWSNGGARLKSELSMATTQCVKEMTRQILAV